MIFSVLRKISSGFLSCHKMFNFIGCSYNSNNCSYQMLYGRCSLIPITYDLFELLKFILCLLDLAVKTPISKLLTSPVCPLMSICMAWDESVYVFILCSLFAPMTLSLFIFQFMKRSTIFNFFVSSMPGWFIIVHRYDIAVAQSWRPLYTIHKNFMTIEWNILSLLPYSSLTLPTLNIHLATGNVTICEKFSPNSCTALYLYYFMLISSLLLLR